MAIVGGVIVLVGITETMAKAPTWPGTVLGAFAIACGTAIAIAGALL